MNATKTRIKELLIWKVLSSTNGSHNARAASDHAYERSRQEENWRCDAEELGLKKEEVEGCLDGSPQRIRQQGRNGNSRYRVLRLYCNQALPLITHHPQGGIEVVDPNDLETMTAVTVSDNNVAHANARSIPAFSG
jgi:hypothetical protein